MSNTIISGLRSTYLHTNATRANAEGLSGWTFTDGPVPTDDARALLTTPAVGYPLEVVTPEGITRDESRQVIMVSGHVVHVASESYAIHQYADAIWSPIAGVLGEGVQLASVGLLRDGARAYAQITTGQTSQVENIPGTEHRPFMVLSSSHDGTQPTVAGSAITWIQCENTLAMALGQALASGSRVKHTRLSVPVMLKSQTSALEHLVKVDEEVSAGISRLMNETVTDAEWAAFLDAFTGLSDAIKGAEGKTRASRTVSLAQSQSNDLDDIYMSDPAAAPFAGTAFGVVQAVNTYAHHRARVRGSDLATRNVERMVSGGFEAVDASALATLGKVTGRMLVAA